VPKLLLADDSPTTQNVVQLAFADEGIEVVVADDGDTALELYDHHHPDIVLADINIPGLNGYEVCESIRKRPSNGSTPVILLAGSFEPFDVEQAHRVGANDYLTKPFASIRRLVATVTALLDTVVRQDAAADETVEPNSVPPNSNEAKPEVVWAPPSSPEQQPGPVLPPEPDMYATDDIQSLINQSFVETVEMPHTVAERVMSEIAGENGEQQNDESGKSFDDAAFDDELIETTYTNETKDSNGQAEGSAAEAPNIEHEEWPAPTTDFINEGSEISSSNGHSPTSASEIHVQQFSEDFAPAQIQHEAVENEAGELPSADGEISGLTQAPTEEFQIDQSNDETYFEPTAEAADQPHDVVNEPVGQTEEVTMPPAEEQTGFEIVSSQEPTEPHEQRDVSLEPQNLESQPAIGEIATDGSPETEVSLEEAEPVREHSPTPTPWDSVAEPNPERFQIDESNLLELPLGFGSRIAEPPSPKENDIAKATSELAPAIVDEIARVTASQISEELVREIAQRIVPRVVEEVMARHRSENDDE